MESEYCPGYCGRIPLNESTQPVIYSECGPCPWGKLFNIN
jgi:hypothetical protein